MRELHPERTQEQTQRETLAGKKDSTRQAHYSKGETEKAQGDSMPLFIYFFIYSQQSLSHPHLMWVFFYEERRRKVNQHLSKNIFEQEKTSIRSERKVHI